MLRIVTLIIIAAAMLLHVYVGYFKASGEPYLLLQWGLIVWAWLPYLVCLLLAVGKRNPLMPLCGALLPLFLDLMTYYLVFINPTSSTAAIAWVVMPLWNLILFMPFGLLTGFLIVRFKKKNLKAQ